MDLHKLPHPDNFRFVERVERASSYAGELALTHHQESLGDDVFALSFDAPVWKKPLRLCTLTEKFEGRGNYRLAWTRGGELRLEPKHSGRAPRPVLCGAPHGSLGVCGRTWMFCFAPLPGDRFFGLGEKWGPLEKSGHRSFFWNTDVWADFSGEKVWEANVESPYVSIPYLIIERRGAFFGILLDTGHPAFVSAGSRFLPWGTPADRPDADLLNENQIFLGALGGPPRVYFLVGSTLRELTKKLQRLVGTTPRPPVWSLGHQQSRWGYGSTQDLEKIDRKLTEHRIPTDGLWLDIDYMDGFRVFSTRPGALDSKGLRGLLDRRRRIVPILDPGVKVEPGYAVYDEGLREGHFCKAPSGKPYTGFVWPGKTHFPDFSQQKTREWWARRVASFAQQGFAGFWIDMNDPATGPIENRSMQFARGRVPHEAFHNQYALGMAIATRRGLQKAAPRLRPFVLSRSGSVGIARYAALWTGDNVSNEHHLRRAIAVSTNLALSGVPFNGPDVPGFGGSAADDLAERFYQATFLFPFLRNHCVHDGRGQEPWAFSKRTLALIRRYIRLRYRFLPYLYQCFVLQERDGEPIIGPSFLDSPQSAPIREDQYLVGRSVLVAPCLEPGRSREIWLPEGDWYCLRTGKWLRGSRSFVVRAKREETPLFVKSGTLLPLARPGAVLPYDGGAPVARDLLSQLELHAFLKSGETARLDYVQDDGESVDYRRGAESLLRVELSRNAGRYFLSSTWTRPRRGPPSATYGLWLHGGGKTVRVDSSRRSSRVETQSSETERLRLVPGSVQLSGDRLAVWRTAKTLSEEGP